LGDGGGGDKLGLMRYLAIDLGEKRTGLAVGDDVTGVINPVGVLEMGRGSGLVEAIVRKVSEHAPDAVVVGLPLNMDGTESEGTEVAREFGAALAARSGKPVHYQDERLSSYAADQRMARSGKTHKQKKELRDALAAGEILRDYLDSRR